jgi:similar to stage IV sporulation protein
MLIGIWKLLFGYVKIKIEGLSIDKLVNRALAEGIELRGLRRIGYARLEAEMFARDHRRFLALSREYPVKVGLRSATGLPYLWIKALGRLGLLAGLAALVGILAAMSRFILVVDVVGTDNTRLIVELREALAGQGIYAGAFAGDLDTSEAERAILLAMDDLSFVGIRVRGMRAIVEAVEKVPVPDMVDRSAPCHVVAAKDAVVVSIDVLDGMAAVRPGDIVKAGQMLVSGQVTLSDGEVLNKHAMANVTGSVWYRGTASQTLLVKTHRYTGREWTRVCLVFPGGRWLLGQTGEEERYDSEEVSTRRSAPMGEGFLLPVWIETTRVRETAADVRLLDFEETLSSAIEQALRSAQSQIPDNAKIVEITQEYRIVGDGMLTAEVYVETEEDIGTEQPFT